MTPEQIRELVGADEVAMVAARVHARLCHCCGHDGCVSELAELPGCGHVMCALCIDAEHDCLACALAV